LRGWEGICKIEEENPEYLFIERSDEGSLILVKNRPKYKVNLINPTIVFLQMSGDSSL